MAIRRETTRSQRLAVAGTGTCRGHRADLVAEPWSRGVASGQLGVLGPRFSDEGRQRQSARNNRRNIDTATDCGSDSLKKLDDSQVRSN